MKQAKNQQMELQREISNFLLNWHSHFILDFWWRRKHNVAFGSSKHREMNWIDMLIEYKEDEEIQKIKSGSKNFEDNIGERMTQEEIDSDYENLDLTQFDK